MISKMGLLPSEEGRETKNVWHWGFPTQVWALIRFKRYDLNPCLCRDISLVRLNSQPYKTMPRHGQGYPQPFQFTLEIDVTDWTIRPQSSQPSLVCPNSCPTSITSWSASWSMVDEASTVSMSGLLLTLFWLLVGDADMLERGKSSQKADKNR